jgi:hypothetical protein
MKKNPRNSTKRLIAIFLSMFLCYSLYGQDSKEEDAATQDSKDEEASALAKKSANPIANLISIPIQANINFGSGDYDRTGVVVNLQPVIPFRLSSKVNVITRTIIPIMSIPDNAESGSTSGIGNINLSMLFVPNPKEGGKFMWGIGPAFNIPTVSNDKLGANAFGIGPTAVGLLMLKKWVIGATFNRLWSYNGSSVDNFFAQYFITYNIKKGWYINTNPNIFGNFNATDGEQWTIPFGLGAGKVAHFGSLPVKLQAQYYYNAVRPTGGAKSTLMLMAVLLFPK